MPPPGARVCAARPRAAHTRVSSGNAAGQSAGSLRCSAPSILAAMPRLPLPPELDELVGRPNPAVVATVRPDGGPHTAATWYDWEGGRVLLNMDETRARLGHMRENPRVSLTVFDGDNWESHVTLFGRVISI